jgi:hypothetical protein
MSSLRDLHPRLRRERIIDALNGVLRQLEGPESTGAVVARVAVLLGLDKEDQNLAARYVAEAAPDHPLSRLTGDTFVRYGKTMKRREWLPSHATAAPNAPIRLSDGERARRRAIIAEHEAEDDWTVQPAPDFLEDEDV